MKRTNECEEGQVRLTDRERALKQGEVTPALRKASDTGAMEDRHA